MPFLDIHVAASDTCHAHLRKSRSLLMKEFGHVILSDEADRTVTECYPAGFETFVVCPQDDEFSCM